MFLPSALVSTLILARGFPCERGMDQETRQDFAAGRKEGCTRLESWTYPYWWRDEQIKAVVAVDFEVLDRDLDLALPEPLLLEEQRCQRAWDDAHVL